MKERVWKDAITEECEYIMKNDVWDVVPIPKVKSIVTSKCLYKIKHGAEYVSIEKYKARFVVQGFSQKREKTVMTYLHPFLDTLLLD